MDTRCHPIPVFDSRSPTLQPLPKEDSNAVFRSGLAENTLGTAVGDAIAESQVVNVVDARSLDETSTAKAVINGSVGDHKEVSLA